MKIEVTAQQALLLLDAISREYIAAYESKAPESRRQAQMADAFALRKYLATQLMRFGAIDAETYNKLYC